MEALEAIFSRKSIRAYRPDQIPEDVLENVLKAGCAAPVATASYDSLHISVVQNKEVLKQISDGASAMASKMMGVKKNMDFGAPTMVIVSAAPGKVPGHENFNAATVLENMAIAATAHGVDNIMWGAAAAVIAHNSDLQKAIGIPDGYKAVLCLSLGYAISEEPAKAHTIKINYVRAD